MKENDFNLLQSNAHKIESLALMLQNASERGDIENLGGAVVADLAADIATHAEEILTLLKESPKGIE